MVKKKEEATVKKDITYYQAIGRKKNATARVRLYIEEEVKIRGYVVKRGEVYINGKPGKEYFSGSLYESRYLMPFEVTDNKGRFGVSAIVVGGGTNGQIGAVILGIARALEKIDKEKYRPILKQHGFLTRDPREKERRKAGFAQKARARKQSPKR